MQPETPSETPKQSWFRWLFDRGTMRGIGTTLGIFFALPFAVLFGLIIGGNLARVWERPDLEETFRWGGLLIGVAGVLVGGCVGGLIGAGLDALRWKVSMGTRALVGALTGILVWVGPAALMGALMVDMGDRMSPVLSPEEKQQRMTENVRTLAAAGALGGAVLGALLGSILKKAEPKSPPLTR